MKREFAIALLVCTVFSELVAIIRLDMDLRTKTEAINLLKNVKSCPSFINGIELSESALYEDGLQCFYKHEDPRKKGFKITVG